MGRAGRRGVALLVAGVASHTFPAGLGWWAVMVVAMMAALQAATVLRGELPVRRDEQGRAGGCRAVNRVAGAEQRGELPRAEGGGAERRPDRNERREEEQRRAVAAVPHAVEADPAQDRDRGRDRTMPLGARGRPADRACLRYGLFHARQCAGACWPLMLAMVPGHGVALMAALTALTSWQRLARRPNRTLCAGALVALMGLVMLAG